MSTLAVASTSSAQVRPFQ
jgi:hypothetical protein